MGVEEDVPVGVVFENEGGVDAVLERVLVDVEVCSPGFVVASDFLAFPVL